MSIYGNPVMLGGSGGGGSTIVSKTITANGTYYASADNADGYSPVIVNVSGGGGAGEKWDFTAATPLVGTRCGWVLTSSGVTFDSSGATFADSYSYIALGAFSPRPVTIELEIGAMNLTRGAHRRFIMGTSENGIIYRSTGKWAFYNNAWEDSTETDGSFFANSTVKVVIDANNKWHIYKNGTLWWEPTGEQVLSAMYIGSNGGYAINNAVIKSLTLR